MQLTRGSHHRRGAGTCRGQRAYGWHRCSVQNQDGPVSCEHAGASPFCLRASVDLGWCLILSPHPPGTWVQGATSAAPACFAKAALSPGLLGYLCSQQWSARPGCSGLAFQKSLRGFLPPHGLWHVVCGGWRWPVPWAVQWKGTEAGCGQGWLLQGGFKGGHPQATLPAPCNLGKIKDRMNSDANDCQPGKFKIKTTRRTH